MDDADRSLLLVIVGGVVRRYGWVVVAYSVMGTHYHVYVETPDANIAPGMQRLNGLYARNFNDRWAQSGHVFQGRYDSRLVVEEAHCLQLFRYLALNPVEAGLVDHPANWPWSSYAATIGLSKPPPFLAVRRALSYFDEHDEARAVARLRELVEGDAFFTGSDPVKTVAPRLLPDPDPRGQSREAESTLPGQEGNAATTAS